MGRSFKCKLIHFQIWPETENQKQLNHSVPILFFIIICALYLGFSWSSALGDFGGDNVYYLFMAQQFSPYSVSSISAQYFAAQSVYPPFFPLLLGLIGGGESLLVAHLATTSFLLIAFLIFFKWLREEGVGLFLSTATVLGVASLPGIYLQTLSIHSENLYLLCSLVAFNCASAAQQKNKHHWMIWAVIAVVASCLTRGAGLALVVAWIVWLWLNQSPMKLQLSVAAILPVILWNYFGGVHSSSYWDQLMHGYHAPSLFINQIWVQIQSLFDGWQRNFCNYGTSAIAGILFLVLGLVSALWRTFLRCLDGFYVWSYLCMIMLWPFPAEAQRLVLLIFPVLLWQTVWMFSKCHWEMRGIKSVNIVLLTIMLLSSLPEAVLNIHRFFTPLPSGIPESYRHFEDWYCPDLHDAIFKIQFYEAIESSLLRLDKVMPENECIFATKPSIIGYLSRRISKFPPIAAMDDASFDHAVMQQGCHFFYLSAFTSPSYPIEMYPYNRLRNRLEILDGATFRGLDGDLHNAGLIARLK